MSTCGIAGQHAGLHGVLDAGVDRGDVLLGDDAAGDLVDELVAAAGTGRLQIEDDVAVLAAAAGLADVAGLDLLDGVLDGLPVGDLGLADVGVDLELAQHPVDEHLEVQLAHAADDGLAGLLVGVHLEGGVLLGEGLEGLGQLVLVVFGLGLDGHVDDRLGEVERLEHDLGVAVAEGVAGGGLLEPDQGHDVAGEAASRSSRWLACICRMRPTRSLRSLLELTTWAAGPQRARSTPGRRSACPRCGSVMILNARAANGSSSSASRSSSSIPLTSMPRVGGMSTGDGQVGDHGVEHGLDALVLERRAAQHRDDLAGDGGGAQGPARGRRR